jgi:hypothetical protein
MLTMRTEDGDPIGKGHQLGLGENPRQVAARLGGQAWRKARQGGDFNRQLMMCS